MKAPILVTKEVAEALERRLLDLDGNKERLLKIHAEPGKWCDESEALNDLSLMDMATALLVGYIVEKTAIEHIQDYYNAPSTKIHEQAIIRTTLTIMGHRVEGVNA
jgi:hypothetical protein